MDSSQAKEKAASKAESGNLNADPFSGDIFAAPRAEKNAEPEDESNVEAAKPPIWVWRLPKVKRPTTDWNALRRNLPRDFADELPRRLGGSMAKILHFGGQNPIEFLFLVEREANEIGAAENDSWWLNVGIETSEAEFAVEIDDVFAAWLVDAMLGENVSDNVAVRDFTSSEIAVLEYLAVNLTHEASKIISAPLFKLRGLSRNPPAWTNRKNAADNFLLVSNWQTVHGFLNSIVKIYVTPETLVALNTFENKLLSAAPRRRLTWNSLQNRVKDVRTRVFLGEVSITLAAVAGLETGDIVLPENYNFKISGGRLDGKVEIFLSDAEQVSVKGSFRNVESDAPAVFEAADENSGDEVLVRRVVANQALQVVVEQFDETENPQFYEKSMANEEHQLIALGDGETAGEFEETGGIALENLAVTLRVELEARRLSLTEIAGLRVNQIIELGARAADPVNLLINDKIVARGELVEVEDRLGVRIIQILR